MKFPLEILIISFLFTAAHECRGIFRQHHRGALMVERQLANSNLRTMTNSKSRFEGDILVRKATEGTQSSAVYQDRIWPNAKIPYQLSNDYNEGEKQIIINAMKAFQDKTCIRFNPRTNERHFIDISRGNGGCSSYVGRQGGSQEVLLAEECVTSTIVKHELMHAIGFYHEQSRTDRDDYVIVHFDNIEPGLDGNFNKYDSRQVQLLRTPYDIRSIMHYGWNYFARDVTRPTITAKNGGARIEPSNDFTETDILDINRLYNCNPGDDSNPNSKYDWKDGNNGQLLWAHDCDFNGNDIGHVKSSGEYCGGHCIADSKCTHFTHVVENGQGVCYLKTASKSAEISPLQGSVCGYITRRNSDFKWHDGNLGQVKYAHGCDFFGNDIRHVKSRGEDCGGLCIAESKCTHFTWGWEGNCYLKTAKNPVASAVTIVEAVCGLVRPRVETTDDSLGLLGTPFSAVNCRTGFILVNGQCVRGTPR